MKHRLRILFCIVALFYVALFIPHVFLRSSKNAIVIGAKNNTECRILAEMMAQLIERHSNIPIKKSLYLEGTFIAYEAVRTGSIDLYVDYTGTLLLAVLKKSSTHNAKKDFEIVRKALKKDHLDVLSPFGFDNSYVLIVRGDSPLRTISDLKNQSVREGFDPEFVIRPEFQDLQNCYDLSFQNYTIMDQSLLYLALNNHSIDLMDGDGTDGKIIKYGCRALHDDKNCLPKYDAVPILRMKTAKKYPEIAKILEPLAGLITSEEMQNMNYEVDMGKPASVVARKFLESHHLYKPALASP